MSQYFTIHPDNPQLRLLREAARILIQGGVIALPTECCYALACCLGDSHLGDRTVIDRIRGIRNLDVHHHFTLICRDLAELNQYARIDNTHYRYLKHAFPGPYTVILTASRQVPSRYTHTKRSTIGLRIPQHPVVRALLAELDRPLLGSTLLLPGEEFPPTEGWEIRKKLEHQLDLVIDSGPCGTTPTTVIDLCGVTPQLRRLGAGDAALFGIAAE